MSRFIFVLGSILLSLVFQVGAFAQTGISIVPPEVALAAPVGSNSAARTSISIVSRNPSVPFSVSFRHLDSATGWLSLSPSSGTTPATVVVTANPTGLQRGTYSAQIVVQGGGTAGVASVLFAVGADTDSRFVADPTGVTFIGIPGLITLEPKFVSITSRPPGSSVGFRAVATSAGNWLSVNPFPGTAPTSLRLDVSQAGLQEGIHRGSVSIIPLTGGAPTIIPVTLVAVGTNTIQPTLVLAQTIVSFNHQY